MDADAMKPICPYCNRSQYRFPGDEPGALHTCVRCKRISVFERGLKLREPTLDERVSGEFVMVELINAGFF